MSSKHTLIQNMVSVFITFIFVMIILSELHIYRMISVAFIAMTGLILVMAHNLNRKG